MAEGWILIHRKIQGNVLWKDKPFDKARAWIDMLLLANYFPNSFLIRGQEVVVERGQLAWSEVSLAERWGWSRNKVRRYLDVLKTKQQIAQHSNNLTTLTTIINYEEYQITGTANDTPNDTASETPNDTPNDTTDGTHKNERKERKEGNEVKKTSPSGDGAQRKVDDYIPTKKKRRLEGKRLVSFRLFWDAFGYKTGRAEAADAWLDIPDMTGGMVCKIVEAARGEARGRPDLLTRGSTPKMAQGWLTSRRWEDEICELPTVSKAQQKENRMMDTIANWSPDA